jgi:predicted DNA-binding WGR domain protein
LPNAISDPGSVRYFEFTGGSSRKFWEITLSGASFTVRFGRTGTTGQSQSKTFPDEARAKREVENLVENLVAEKVKKGYLEKESA